MSVQTFRVGGFATDTVSDIINLWASAATLNFGTFRKSGATSGYQVAAGKQFWICQVMVMYGDDTGSDVTAAIGYADNDVGMSTTTARTNPVPLIGNPEGSYQSMGGLVFDGTPAINNSDGARVTFNGIWKGAPGSKYMYFQNVQGTAGTGVSVMMTGFEV